MEDHEDNPVVDNDAVIENVPVTDNPSIIEDTAIVENITAIENQTTTNNNNDQNLQELQERARIAQENFEREEKLRKELEVINAKITSERNDLQRTLEGEKGSLTDLQDRAIKLAAQKMDLESQLLVS